MQVGTPRISIILAVAALCGLGQGCVATRTYVDPTYARATYRDLPRLAQPYMWRIVVETQRYGQRFPLRDGSAQATIERVIRDSGLALPSEDTATGRLKITIRNASDASTAMAKGFSSGLTLGLVGTLVTDIYQMEAELYMDGEIVKRSGYTHALHTTLGNVFFAPIAQAMPIEAAFHKVLEQMTLNFLKDLRIAADIPSAVQLQ